MDIKLINKKIGEIKRSGKALQDKIVAVEIAAMRHCETHRDSGALTRLVLAVPSAVRREALKIHIVDHVPLTCDDEKQTFKAKKKGTFNIEGAEKVTFYEYTKETVAKIDLDKLLVPLSLIEAAEKRIEKVIDSEGEIKGDMDAYKARLTLLKSLAA